jgi:FlaA1/EpsC-like NDP-sugar epimerase
MKVKLSYWRTAIMLVLLAVVAAVSLFAAFLLRFEFRLPDEEFRHLTTGLVAVVVMKLFVFHVFRCDRGGWRYTGFADLTTMVAANVVASVTFAILMLANFGAAFPRSIYIVDLLICFLGTTGLRLSVRMQHEYAKQFNTDKTQLKGVLI